MQITTDEIAEAWPQLPENIQQAIMLRIAENRLAKLAANIKQLEHQVAVLEEAVKMPEGFARSNHSTEHEMEFMASQLQAGGANGTLPS